MTFKASIDGTPKYGNDSPVSDNAEEVTIETRHTTYTLWTDGDDLIVSCNSDFKTIYIEKPRQVRLETL